MPQAIKTGPKEMYEMGGQPFWVDERGVYHLAVPEGRHDVRMPMPEQPPLPEAGTPPTEEITPPAREGPDYERLSGLYPGITVSPPTEGATEIDAPSLGYYGSAEALPGALEFKRSEERKLEQLQERQRTAAEAKKKFPTREQFEQRFLAGKLGQYYNMVEQRFGIKVSKTDPYMLNSTVLANELYQKDVKRVWTEFFPSLRWGSPLTAKQKRAWQDKHTEFQQWSYANGQMIVEGAKDLYKTGMGMYEDRKKEWEAKRKEARIGREKAEKEVGRLKRIEEEERLKAGIKKEFEKPPSKLPEKRYKMQEAQTMMQARTQLTENSTSKDAYDTSATFYNNNNKRNEVAYWDTKGRNKTKFIKLPAAAVKAKWTAKKVQEAADERGRTIKEVLTDIGILK